MRYHLLPASAMLVLLTACHGGGGDSGDSTTDGDGDASDVTTEHDGIVESCGNGVWEDGEECDGSDLMGQTCESLGFPGGTLACTPACTLDTSGCSECGDGAIGEGEQCEDGDLAGQSCESLGYDGGALSCGSECLFDASGCEGAGACGNGIVDEDEDCDSPDLDDQDCVSMGFDGGSLDCTDACSFDTSGCTDCGNGSTEAGEQCDGSDLDGQTCAGLGYDHGSLGCTASCTFDASACTDCGNGSAEDGEQCDGDDLDGESCDSLGYGTGELACGGDCNFDISGCEGEEICGNGIAGTGEDCDGTDLDGESCDSLGYHRGILRCTAGCNWDTSACTNCGNGTLETGEECDGPDLDGNDCTGLGFHGGALICSATCTFDTSWCHDCGDGSIDGSEACDSPDLGGETCTGLGYIGGTLDCTETCSFDTSGCTSCGNGIVDPGEDCDGDDLAGYSCLALGYVAGRLGCGGSCTFDVSECDGCGNGAPDPGEDCDDGNLIDWDGCTSCEITEFVVPDTTSAAQWFQDVGLAPDGRHVVVWADSGALDGDSSSIRARLFDAAGVPLGADMQVNTYFTSSQEFPAVTMASDGRFIATWHSYAQDGSDYGVFFQRHLADGTRDGAELQANEYSTLDQRWPDIAMSGDGRFIVAWCDEVRDGDSWGVYARLFQADGTPASSDIQANTYTTGDQRWVSVGIDDLGRSVVVWESIAQDGDDDGVFAQRFDATGAPLGTEFQVNTYTTNDQSLPSVAMRPDGSFIVVWQSYGQDGQYWGVFAQRYASNGTPDGSEFQVNTTTSGYQWVPSVSTNATGEFLVVWESRDSDDYGIFAQRFDASASPVGSEFQVNVEEYRDQEDPIGGMTADGRFLVSYRSESQDGSSYGIFMQRYDDTGGALGTLPW